MKGCFKKAAIWLAAKLCRIVFACLKNPDFVYDPGKALMPAPTKTPEQKIERLFSGLKTKAETMAEIARQLCKLCRNMEVSHLAADLLVRIRDCVMHSADFKLDKDSFSLRLSKFFKDALQEKYKELRQWAAEAVAAPNPGKAVPAAVAIRSLNAMIRYA